MRTFIVFLHVAAGVATLVVLWLRGVKIPLVGEVLRAPYVGHVVAAGIAVMLLGMYAKTRRPSRLAGDGPGPTRRIAPSVASESLVIRLQDVPPSHAAALLAYMTTLPGVRAVASRWDRTGENSESFAGYFVFRERLFAVETVYAGHSPTRLGIPIFHQRLDMSLQGQPPDEAAFAEVERHAQTYTWQKGLRTLPTQMRFSFLPSTPPKALFKYRSTAPEATAPRRFK